MDQSRYRKTSSSQERGPQKRLSIIVNHENATAKVIAPFNEAFVPRMKALNGVWDRPMQCWWVAAAHIPAIRQAMRDVFGADDTGGNGDNISLLLRFSEDVGNFREDVIFYGKILSHAANRNSGGTAGVDVTYLSGRAESGGSIKNWCSIVPAGAVVQLSNVPKTLLDKEKLPESVALEVLPDMADADHAALREERTRLMERIREIDLILNKSR